jgi:DinB family protein
MTMTESAGIRKELITGLIGDDAHMSFEEAVTDFPEWAINARPPNVDYTPWHILEHLRITQWDILRYIVDPSHVSPEWPVEYWPEKTAEATPEQFQATIDGFLADRRALEAICRDPAADLLGPMPHAPRHSIAREVRVVANHNSYHTGEFAVLRQLMGSWGEGHDD